LRRILLFLLLFVFAGTSVIPNYSMKNLISPSSNDVIEQSSTSITADSKIIGEYPTKGKKLFKKSTKVVDVSNSNPQHLPIRKNKHLYISNNKINLLYHLTPCQFQSNYL
jgi:hypothetical protein